MTGARGGVLAGVAIIVAVLGLAELAGDPLRWGWSLERAAVLDGQLWRLATAHLVHLSRAHTIMNIAALILVCATLWPGLTTSGFLRSVGCSGLAISLGWVALQPAGAGYVGFSGITHGVFTFGALVMLRRGPVAFGRLLMILLTLKLGQEFFFGAVPGVAAEIGGPVALQAHALGAFGGALAALHGASLWACLIVLALTAALALSHAGVPLNWPVGADLVVPPGPVG